MVDLEYQLKRDPITGLYYQVPVETEKSQEDNVVKNDVQNIKPVLKLNKKV